MNFFPSCIDDAKKRKICSICFTTTRIWLVGTISRRALCVIRTVLIVWIHITRRKAFQRLCVQRFTWLSFWACHIISKGKMEVDEPTKARVLTAKWMPYLWTTKNLFIIYYFFSLFIFEILCAISCCYYCYVILLFSSFHKVHIAWSWVWKDFKCQVLICSEGI